MADARSKKRRKTIVFSGIGLVLAGLTLLVIFRKREVIITVQTEKVARRNLTELVVANGKIQPVVQVVIQPEVSGEIIDLPVIEGQQVKKGDVLLRIKQGNYLASKRSAEASYRAALSGKNLAQAHLSQAELEFKRFKELFDSQLVSGSQFLEAKTTLDVMQASFENSCHQAEQAKASLAKVEDDLSKTTILAPMDGTVTRLRSQKGERVVGTALMAGTEIMTVADLHEMEARVDIGEIDVILIQLGQKARLEVDAFHDRKFSGVVTEIANAAKGPSAMSPGSSSSPSSAQQEATKFEVKIRIQEREPFRPGMSVTAEIETRSRTNVLCVPIQSVTTRVPKKPDDKKGKKGKPFAETNAVASMSTNSTKSSESKKPGEAAKPLEVVFTLNSDYVKMVPVKRGISDDAYVEIVEGLQEGQEIVSGGYKAINRELEEAKKIKRGSPVEETEKDKK
jgi:HlyD family secretion protein